MLIQAILKEDVELAKKIICSEELDKSGRGLILATRKNYVEIVKLLIEKEFDVNVKDVYGRTALSWAIELEHKEIAHMLIMVGGKIEETKQIWFGH